MQIFRITGFGLALAALDAGLIRRFGARANRTGIGTFPLLPLSGFAYAIGILCIVVGTVFILLGLRNLA